jgi:hypothetical protein
MRSLVLLFPLASIAYGADFVAVRSGDWSSGATWGGTVPGDGDTASVPDGQTVTVSDSRTIGWSGPNGTVALALNSTGALLITGQGMLKVRGDVSFAGTENLPVPKQISILAGGTWEWDSSAAASPQSTHYFLQTTVLWRHMLLSFAGSAAGHVTVKSNPAGGSGGFGVGSTNTNIGVLATYTDFIRLGDASNHAFAILYDGSAATTWNVTHSTFTACGSIFNPSNVGVRPPDVFIHSYNVHSHTASAGVFEHWFTIEAKSSGTREVRNNVFDVSMSRDYFYPGGFIISGNYFGDATSLGGFDAWTLWTDNFVRLSDSWALATGGTGLGVYGDLSDSYIFADSDWGNPHVLNAAPTVTSSLKGVIFGQAGTALGPPGAIDSGELWFLTNPAVPATYGLYNSIVLPNMAGYSSLELGSMLPSNSNLRSITEHNTWFGGWSRGTAIGAYGFAAVQLGEGGNGVGNSVVSFRYNVLWNPQLPSYTSSFFKLADIGSSGTPTLDYCAPSDCDYNTGFGHTVSGAGTQHYANQGKGYVANFSAPPGQHDIDVDPMFLDWQRSAELFDSKYLGNVPAAWNSGSAYFVGDFVRNSRADIYWNLPVNYRYVNEGECAGTNPEPGAGVHWRDCWEFASLYRLRTAIQAGTKYRDMALSTDGDPGCAPGTALSPTMAVVCWIRRGYTTGNPSLWSSHDGADPGAVHTSRIAHGLGLSLP